MVTSSPPSDPSQPPTQPGPPPPPPTPEQDPVALIYAAKPMNVRTVVRQMGELVHGEPLSPATAAKIEKFLNEPPAPPETVNPAGVRGTSYYAPGITDGTSNTLLFPEAKGTFVPPIFPGGDPLPVAPAPRAVAARPAEVAPAPRAGKVYKPDINSNEFKARVREALHAMMCLPEYQLN